MTSPHVAMVADMYMYVSMVADVYMHVAMVADMYMYMYVAMVADVSVLQTGREVSPHLDCMAHVEPLPLPLPLLVELFVADQ